MTIAESYIQGVSTRKIEELVKNFGLNRLSASQVSRLCKILDEKVEEFLKRQIEVKIRYLLVDTTYFKLGCGAQYKNGALLVVVGIREEGQKGPGHQHSGIEGQRLLDDSIHKPQG